MSFVFFFLLALIYLRYVDEKFEIVSKIEILDKAQESEMSLPTSMTIFNRSMINLENEIGVLSSDKLHRNTINDLKYNIQYFNVGLIKETQVPVEKWHDNFKFDLKVNLDTVSIRTYYYLDLKPNGNLKITVENKDNEFINSYDFNNLSTYEYSHDLPFDINFSDVEEESSKILIINPIDQSVQSLRNKVTVEMTGKESDQLIIKMIHSSKDIAEKYLNTLVYNFNMDGITDRQLEYKRTIEFVDSRAEILRSELEVIENNLQKYKENNNLSDISVDANININQKLNYSSDLFLAESQIDLAEIILESLDKNDIKLLPVNIGLDNEVVNQAIIDFNNSIKELSRLKINA